METQKFLKSKQFKMLLGLTIVLGIIFIARAGYDFGQWLHQAIN
jgi:heme/copper-type cytochrome/quinol oxidase subunit 3